MFGGWSGPLEERHLIRETSSSLSARLGRPFTPIPFAFKSNRTFALIRLRRRRIRENTRAYTSHLRSTPPSPSIACQPAFPPCQINRKLRRRPVRLVPISYIPNQPTPSLPLPLQSSCVVDVYVLVSSDSTSERAERALVSVAQPLPLELSLHLHPRPRPDHALPADDLGPDTLCGPVGPRV